MEGGISVGSFKKINLRPVGPADLRPAYEWMCCSDSTASMLEPPDFPDSPVPTWEEFCDDWKPYFDGSAPDRGRCFIILADGDPVGVIAHSDIYAAEDGHLFTEIDIWLRSRAHCGQGYGPQALNLLCAWLEQESAVREFVMQPSGRNTQALRAYQKAGFVRVGLPPKEAAIRFQTHPDYRDSVFLVKRLVDS
jgi:diamine N-acetyltransferase